MHCCQKSQRSIDCAALLLDVYSSVGYHDIALRAHLSLKKGPLFFTAKLFFSVTQQPVQHLTKSQAHSYHPAKTFLKEDVILPELSDNLCDVPEDI
jgi:hypothetical protein